MAKGDVRGERGKCIAKGGMCGEKGACMAKGGMHGKGGHAWQRGACMVYDEIRSMSGWYASHWNAYLLAINFALGQTIAFKFSSQNVLITSINIDFTPS